MRLDTASLASIVAAVADGWPQDWGALEVRADDDAARRALRNLRVVAGIAEFHRSLSETDRVRSASPESPKVGAGEATSPDGHTPVPARGWGRFQLLKKLGEGAYGDVYWAHDTQLDRDVALKLLKPSRSSDDQAPRLLGEARMLARVRHPNVASVYGAEEHDGRAGMWMELIRGLTLEELLLSRGPMSAGETALVGQDLCRALAAVHGAGLVHRDVKTTNVIREVGGRIVLTDFGAGRCPGRDPRHQFVGTPLYVAPEVVAGSEATELSDIYSLGVVLFRLVTGVYPRKAGGIRQLLEAQDRGACVSLRDLRPDLPDTFVSAVEQALARDPLDRPHSVGALRAALGLVFGAPASWRKTRPASHARAREPASLLSGP